MAAKYGRRKGCRGEREVAELCEAWWQQLEPGCKFRRTPSSGGWGGKGDADVRAHFNACGDLMTTAKQWPYCVEVKWREGWSFERFLFGGTSPVWGWWEQCKRAAETQGHRPLLFFRNRELPWLMLTETKHLLNGYRDPLTGYWDDNPGHVRVLDRVGTSEEIAVLHVGQWMEAVDPVALLGGFPTEVRKVSA